MKTITTTNASITRRVGTGLPFEDPVLGGTFVQTRRPKQSKIAGKVVSLFTGAGGLDLGLEAAGYDTAAYVEIDPDCRRTIALNRKWGFADAGGGDIRATKSSELLKIAKADVGEVAIVAGGAPCQPFSNIGKREGTASEQGNLFKDFMRVVRDLKPAAFIFENVSAITGSKHADVLDTIRRESERIGYGVGIRILNAADYGVPQRRLRLFAIGIRDARAQVAMPFPTHAGDPDKFASAYKAIGALCPGMPRHWQTVRDAIGRLRRADFDREDCRMMTVSSLTLSRMKYLRPGTRDNFKAIPPRLLPDCWKSGKHQGADTFGRMLWDEPAVTIRTCGYHPMKGRYIHPDEHRGFNTVELMRLQAFPKDFRFSGGLISVGRQIGNAVPPPLAEAIGLAIRAQLERLP